MAFVSKVKEFLDKYFFNVSWTCNNCGKEVFNGEYFCDECLNSLAFNNESICVHCGRKTIVPEEYCLTCQNRLVNIDIGRSVFNYDGDVKKLILGFKDGNKRYLSKVFAKYLYEKYKEWDLSADYITYVPMTKKAKRKRGFNQSKLLAIELSKLSGIEVKSILEKAKDTLEQKSLNRAEREKNLKSAFRVILRKSIKDKTVLLVDDVTTTGATAEIIAEKLKRAGAKEVKLLTIASVSATDFS